ncbi:MAG: glycosyltransferase family 4 protein [Gammaproteobacteria bacterium]|nr:glycosyltransferase family 4 protein [Gammaproteobacteria bacterium]MDH3410931.1 glycosyltransferase family 4 protein [Gammaproteobacteria bacterium]
MSRPLILGVARLDCLTSYFTLTCKKLPLVPDLISETPRMRVGVEACTWANRRGYGRFTRELVSTMVTRHPQHRFVLVVDSHTARECLFPAGTETVVVDTAAQPTKAAAADGSRSLQDVWRMSRALANARFDVVLFPTRYTFVPMLRRTPVVLTIHDATDVKHPRLLFPTWRSRLLWKMKSQLAIRRADRIVTVSNDARRQIAAAFGLREASIAVVSEGPDAVFRPRPGDSAVERIRDRYQLPRAENLILYVGGISPHKNLDTLLRAAAIVRKSEPGGWHMVLVGDYQGDSFLGCYRELSVLARALAIADVITFTGFVPDDDLALLYNAATLLALPSKGEGFGLPVVEAMACGLPVIASNRNSLPEVLGGAGMLFDPDSDQALAACILRLLREPALRADLRARGLDRARAYTWDAGADTMVCVLEDAAARR